LVEDPVTVKKKPGQDEDEEEYEDRTPPPPPNMIYRGEWQMDLRHGYGVQEFYDGSRFEG
jgi:hypothetical protein